jgi:hypothetical protein
MVERCNGGVGFHVDALSDEVWLEFLDGVSRRAGVPDDWFKDHQILDEFRDLVVQMVRKIQLELSVVDP